MAENKNPNNDSEKNSIPNEPTTSPQNTSSEEVNPISYLGFDPDYNPFDNIKRLFNWTPIRFVGTLVTYALTGALIGAAVTTAGVATLTGYNIASDFATKRNPSKILAVYDDSIDNQRFISYIQGSEFIQNEYQIHQLVFDPKTGEFRPIDEKLRVNSNTLEDKFSDIERKARVALPDKYLD